MRGLYCKSDCLLRSIIAYAYVFMLAGYLTTYVFEVAPDPQSGFCTELNVTLRSAASYIDGSHTLGVVNGDAQAADVSFPIDYMSITSVDVPAGPNPVAAPANASVKGRNFVSPTQFRWYDQAGTPVADLANATLVATLS